MPQYYRSLMYAFLSVILWSLSASIANFLNNEANYAGFTIGIMLCGVMVFGTWSWYTKDEWRPQVRESLHTDNKSSFRLVLSLLGFSVFLTLYDLAFYYSIQQGPSVQANIINYLWPILFPALGISVFRRKNIRFGIREVGIMSLAFGGVILIIGNPLKLAANGFRYSYIVALLAAVSAGLYLNFFAIAEEYTGSTVLIYFIGVTVATPAILIATWVTDIEILITGSSVPYVLGYGVLGFAGGQFAWGKAISIGDNTVISAIAYLTPVLSTVFLNVLTEAPITNTVAFAAVLIISSQVLLNDTFRHFSSTSGAVVAIFLSSLFLYVNPQLVADTSFFTALDDVISTIFAILTSFMLNRVRQNNKLEDQNLRNINTDLKSIVRKIDESEGDVSRENRKAAKDSIYELMISIVNMNYESKNLAHETKQVKDSLAQCKEELHGISTHSVRADGAVRQDTRLYADGLIPAADIHSLEQNISEWLMSRQERVSKGEMLILFTLAICTIALLLVTAGGSFASSIVAVAVIGAVVFSVLKIRDYNYNQAGTLSKVLLEQEVMQELDEPMYVP